MPTGGQGCQVEISRPWYLDSRLAQNNSDSESVGMDMQYTEVRKIIQTEEAFAEENVCDCMHYSI